MSMTIAGATTRGPRENNEDSWAAVELQFGRHKGYVLGVYDGVGGCSKGELASDTACRTVSTCLFSALVERLAQADTDELEQQTITPEVHSDMLLELVRDACVLANEAVVRRAASDADLKSMATTAVVVLVVDGLAFLAWAGDSRCYMTRAGRLRQLTRDHSELQRLVDAGVVESEHTESHPLTHVIYRYLGRAEGFELETRILRLLPGDGLLLCSDGLSDAVDDSVLARLINDAPTVSHLPQQLLEQVVAAGPTDNTTVVFAKYEPTGDHNPHQATQTVTSDYPAELANLLRHR